MGKTYPWYKIDDIQLKKHNREIVLIKKLPVIGNIKTKINYGNDEVEECIEKMRTA